MSFPSFQKMSLARREALAGYAFVVPWIIGFLIFTIGPMLASLYFSFTRYNIIDPPQWVGLANYQKAFSGIWDVIRTGDPSQFKDPLFWKSLQVTIYYASIALPLNLAFSFFLAVLLNQKVRGINIWRTVYFLPSIIAGVAVTLLWVRILNPRVGVLNPFLKNVLGVQNPPGWLADPEWAVPALVIMGLWSVGGTMIIYLAGLQGVPTDLYDAAKVDGANAWQRFWNVTFPMMTPVLFYNLVLGMIATFQYFTQVYVATSSSLGGLGSPQHSTLFYNVYLYQNAFRYFDMGYASTLAWILFIIVLSLTALVFRSSDIWVYYEGQLKGRG
ncbi:MAG TPA: sugar ABC transporter permease [Anaerolineales bacterium]|nr:sugar ABC transporter permease [Anaerolineales bacterium]